MAVKFIQCVSVDDTSLVGTKEMVGGFHRHGWISWIRSVTSCAGEPTAVTSQTVMEK